MSKLFISALVLLFSFSAMANDLNLDGFNKRFKIVKSEDGKVMAIKMKLFSKKFTLKPYLLQLKNDLKSEIDRMRNKNGYNQELEDFISYLEANTDKNQQEVDENVTVVRNSMNNLPSVDVDGMFKKVQGKEVLKRFEIDLKKALLNFSLSVVANPEDARFFYRRNVTYEVVTRAIEFAKKRFDNIPLLNLASFIIVKVHDLIIEQRLYHQNMLLHYLENVPEEKLGLTKDEADRVFSSIYESRISAINYWESNNAANNWARYGLNKFYETVRLANNKIRRQAYQFESIDSRYNYAFVEVVENGERLVKNLVVNKHSFSGKMSTAYNYAKPDKIRRIRALLNLGQVGLGFLPIPGWLKAQVESFVESFYVQQKRVEGALVAYFESQQNYVMRDNIKKQLINPYLVH